VISWAVSDGRSHEGDRVVPAASTIKLVVASAFWRSGLDPAEPVDVPTVPWSVTDALAAPTLGDCALLMLAISDNAGTNVLIDRLGFDAVNAEAARLGCEHTELRRKMISDGPENLTCASDLVRVLAAIADEPRIVDALSRAGDSELHLLLPDRQVAVKTGTLWPGVHHQATLVDGTLALAVCSAPAVLPSEVAAVAAQLVRETRL
jgi:beta-lactamase class A